ncbi:MAG: histidine phosphatase family protein [Steroidobacteraceae bacterium]
MNHKVLLVRHAAVALRWRGRCYGSTDVGLSRDGMARSRDIAREILRRHDANEIGGVIHSGLRRARYLAERIAEATGADIRVDERWRERDFGMWETRTWTSIWRESGSAMDRMLTEPDSYRPGGGETTAELFRRSVAAWKSLPRSSISVVVTHGGPIACVRCHLAKAPIAGVAEFRIAEGRMVEIRRDCEKDGPVRTEVGS